ncbi:MAG: dolichyl-phosphate beta-glucosyltransferase [Bacteroidia bacterium]
MVELSIIFPAYNEVDRIGKTLHLFSNYLNKKGIIYELIIVDDGSTDETVNFVKKLQKKIPAIIVIPTIKNYGKGHAVRIGMLQSKGKIRLFSDADGSTPIECIDKVIAPIINGDYDISIGSRYLKDSELDRVQPFIRKMWSNFANAIIRKYFIPGIYDLHCGFKAFKAQAAIDIFSKCIINGWTFDIEVLGIARNLKFKITEVPVKWSNDERSKGSFLHLPKEIYSLLKIKKQLQKYK